MSTEMRRIGSLDELEAELRENPELFLRYSEGPDADREGGSMDSESGLEMPGLSVNPMHPESWWTRPVTDWLARQLCQYKDLAEKNPERFAWVLRGERVGNGPDCEPLMTNVEPIARLEPSVLEEAERVYEENFDAGQGPED
ncbi:DUF6098 family protein [Brachybacterium sp. GCM10030267]|uniref:DUF6098 family protein n=1 Tax=unclassified Brachybacterium TaxID=2623841 RepID=UPI00361C4E5D